MQSHQRPIGSAMSPERSRPSRIFDSVVVLLLFHGTQTVTGFHPPATTNHRHHDVVSWSLHHQAVGGGEDPEVVMTSKTTSDVGLTDFIPGQATQRLGLSSAPTVWTEFGRIAQQFEPVNLGQGYPDWLPPKFAVDSLVEAVLDSAQSPHQYTRPAGHPNLVKQLARRYSIHMKQEIKPMEEVAVTVGASQALYLSLQTLINPGALVVRKFNVFFRLILISLFF